MRELLEVLDSIGRCSEQELRYQLERLGADVDEVMVAAYDLVERGLVSVEWSLTAAGRAEAA